MSLGGAIIWANVYDMDRDFGDVMFTNIVALLQKHVLETID